MSNTVIIPENSNLLKYEYLSNKYDQNNIPLYLSYPTERFWRSQINKEECFNNYKMKDATYLYFHFPFCNKICFYCCCYRQIVDDKDNKEVYLKYLKNEIVNKCNTFKLSGKINIEQMHWGGGTPTCLTLNQIEDMFNFISNKINLRNTMQSNISIEAYPNENELYPFGKPHYSARTDRDHFLRFFQLFGSRSASFCWL